MVSDRLKDIIFKKLYKELPKVEIIPYKDSVYFIDRDNKYWYFEYEKKGMLWWRYDFFHNFFVLFSLESHECEKVMGEWVEEVLNCKVNTTNLDYLEYLHWVEEVLNCKVNTTEGSFVLTSVKVEEVLNCKVNTTEKGLSFLNERVEEVLNCKVNTTDGNMWFGTSKVEEVLNCKVNTTSNSMAQPPKLIDDILNHKVDVTMARITDHSTEVGEVLDLDTVL